MGRVSERGEQAGGLLGGVGADLGEVDAVGWPPATSTSPSPDTTSVTRMPGVNATCHGESAWSYVHVTRSSAASGMKRYPFVSHVHGVSGLAVTSRAGRRRRVIGGGGSKVRGIRDLIAELALLPVEGGARVAIVESAHRMNEDAQAALLKTLEEPPPATRSCCAPTPRSRCPRSGRAAPGVQLGPVGVRDIEAILGEAGAADPPLAARVARPPAADPAWRSPGSARQTPCASATPSAGH